MNDNAAAQIERTFREEHGCVLAALISQLGDFMLAEDALLAVIYLIFNEGYVAKRSVWAACWSICCHRMPKRAVCWRGARGSVTADEAI
jgi:predicted RNA polymerase sigma factor